MPKLGGGHFPLLLTRQVHRGENFELTVAPFYEGICHNQTSFPQVF
jgi:hypothetical protein